MKIALLQLNLLVGDVEGNAAAVLAAARHGAEAGASLLVTSELAISGYPPRDLLLQEGFLERCAAAVAELARELAGGPPLLVGTPTANDGPTGKPCRNSAALCREGVVAALFHKSLLPTYDVFDEARYFEPSPEPDRFELDGRSVGVTICEDIWNDPDFWPRPNYAGDPIKALDAKGVDILVNLSASPYTLCKQAFRQEMVGCLAKKYATPICFANQVGGNDDLIFDGRSFMVNAAGQLAARAPAYEEALLVVEPQAPLGAVPPSPDMPPEEEAFRALTLGLRDYARKSGFTTALLGLSGGIDSSLTAAVAVEALGHENVLGVLMPSPYSSQSSLDDAYALAVNLGVATETIPIAPLMTAFDDALAQVFNAQHAPPAPAVDVTAQNLQARIRGNLLMALSNKQGRLLLTTGNKSELAVGYCTIYGDMSGGLAVISDAPKTLVFRLCSWLNSHREREIIPEHVIVKPPSAELAPDQRDEDSLPPYDVLDRILELYVEKRHSVGHIVAQGFEEATVRHVARLVKNAEFKRRQAAPGLKITDRAFGSGWRMPLAARW